MLTQEDRQRYRRHLQLPEIGEEGQARLLGARVLVVGAGGLGCPVLQYLAAAGVGTLGIADSDRVELSNLQRQVLFGNADIGQMKAEAAARAVKRLNPSIRCEIHARRVDRVSVEKLVGAYDLVVDGSDNFATRYLLNDACVSVGRPLVSGAIYKFEGQVSVFNYQDGPTYRCLFPTTPSAAEAPNCDTTGVLGVLPGLIGCAQATEALKVLMGLGEVLRGRLWVFDALSFQSRILRFSRHPEHSLLNLSTASPTDYAELCSATPVAITAPELAELLASEAPPFLLDVREPEEYYRFHLPGATLIPLSQVVARASLLPRHHPIVVYCHHGGRSAAAITELQTKAGFTNLQNLTGGIHAWALEVDPTMPQY
ncbi:molybdenum cofactor biosynthesis protein MoeB [Hymenobacter qilianensis]|uniref:Molybdenum cofactor biosynthesis protein MoeB n=1 Tax=Hymenobacter qilianensis TaxID=1385715 RepID=A0ACB5PPG2_9BACT|nr:molybdopterin-synthase adenylyltransferase MoeB [Hymenobacter qilianensis]GGF59044.1 molybdenum cofactor biosynthesis protein MoeB [Hymenobacter qilianensis]